MEERTQEGFSSKELAEYVASAKKRTLVRAFVQLKGEARFDGCKVVGTWRNNAHDGGNGGDGFCLVVGDEKDFKRALDKYGEAVVDYYAEYLCANSGVGLADVSTFGARIEPFAVVREKVFIAPTAVVMMGAVLNIGCSIGERTMIDMNAVIGSNAKIGNDCHVGAGAVVAGVLEPVDATPVVVEEGVTLGANCVVLEGRRIGANSVVGAGAVVTEDIPPYSVAVGCPAVVKKRFDKQTALKTQRNGALFDKGGF